MSHPALVPPWLLLAVVLPLLPTVGCKCGAGDQLIPANYGEKCVAPKPGCKGELLCVGGFCRSPDKLKTRREIAEEDAKILAAQHAAELRRLKGEQAKLEREKAVATKALAAAKSADAKTAAKRNLQDIETQLERNRVAQANQR